MTIAQDSQVSASGKPARGALVDLGEIDLGATCADRDEIARWNPHRSHMALLDRIVWVDEDLTRGVAAWKVREDEFWVPGHFPGRPLLPGVLQIEAGAQLACYLYNKHKGDQQLAAFLRIENAVFRNGVEPGQTLYILCREVKRSARRFITEIQGVVDDKTAFEGLIHGMNLDGRRG